MTMDDNERPASTRLSGGSVSFKTKNDLDKVNFLHTGSTLDLRAVGTILKVPKTLAADFLLSRRSGAGIRTPDTWIMIPLL